MTNEQLLICADLCVQSYDPDRCPDGFVDVDDLRYGVHLIDGVCYKTVRGTANAVNVLRDIWVRPARVSGGPWAHKGFVSGFDRLAKEGLLDLYWDVPTVYGGHSYGGAVALLMANYVGNQSATFGCPNPYLLFNGEPDPLHTRVRTDDDPVTLIPALFYHMPTPGQEIVLHDTDREWIDVKDHSMGIYRRRLTKWVKSANG